jgi:hypothetical protein
MNKMVDLRVYFKDKYTHCETIYVITVSQEDLEKCKTPLDKWLFVQHECISQLFIGDSEIFEDYHEV